MRRVVIESPYAGDVDRNLKYLRAAMRDCILRGDSPYASHGLLTQDGVLDDDHPEERLQGIHAAHCWAEAADVICVYTDLGISPGMAYSISRHQENGHVVEERTIEGWGTLCHIV